MLKSLPHKRRIKSILFSRFFTTIIVLLIIVISTYFIFFTDLIKKKPPTIPTIPEKVIEARLVSYEPSSSSDSAQLLIHESQSISNDSFDTLVLNNSGHLYKDQTATISGTGVVLVNDALPSQDQLKNFYELWYQLSTSEEKPMIWLHSDHFGFLYYGALVVISSYKSPISSLDALQQIRSQSSIKLVGSILDLRFDKPVVIQDQM